MAESRCMSNCPEISEMAGGSGGAQRAGHDDVPNRRISYRRIRQRGVITVEYAVLLSLVAVGVSFAVYGLLGPLRSYFLAQQLWLLLPIP